MISAALTRYGREGLTLPDVARPLFPPSDPDRCLHAPTTMTARLVLVIGDLFIPDRAPVSRRGSLRARACRC